MKMRLPFQEVFDRLRAPTPAELVFLPDPPLPSVEDASKASTYLRIHADNMAWPRLRECAEVVDGLAQRLRDAMDDLALTQQALKGERECAKQLRAKVELLCQCDAMDGYTCAGHRTLAVGSAEDELGRKPCTCTIACIPQGITDEQYCRLR